MCSVHLKQAIAATDVRTVRYRDCWLGSSIGTAGFTIAILVHSLFYSLMPF